MGVNALLSRTNEPIMLDGLGNSKPRLLNSLGKKLTPSTVDSGGRGSSCSPADAKDSLLDNARDRLSMVQQLLRDVELSSSSAAPPSYSSSKKCHAAAKQNQNDVPRENNTTSREAIIRRRHSLCISRFVSTEPIKISTKTGTHTNIERTTKSPTEEEPATIKTELFNRSHSLSIQAQEEKKDLRNLFESCIQGQDQTVIVPLLHERPKSSNDLSNLSHAANTTKSLSSKIQSLREQIVLSQVNTMRFQQNQRKVGVCSKTRLPHEPPMPPPKLDISYYKPRSTRSSRDKNDNDELQPENVSTSRLNFLSSYEAQKHISDLVRLSRMSMQANRHVPRNFSDNTTAEHCRITSFDCDTDNPAHDSGLLNQMQVPKNKPDAPSTTSSSEALPDPPESDCPRQEDGTASSQASKKSKKKSPSQQPQEELDKSALSLFSDPLSLVKHKKEKDDENETVMATKQRMYPKDKKKQSNKKKLDPKGTTTTSSSRNLRRIKSEGSSGTSKNYKLRRQQQQQLQQLYPRSLSTPGNVSSHTVGRTQKSPHFQNHTCDNSHKIQRMEQLKLNIDMQRNLKKEKQKTKDGHIIASGGRTIKANNVSAKTGRDSCFA